MSDEPRDSMAELNTVLDRVAKGAGHMQLVSIDPRHGEYGFYVGDVWEEMSAGLPSVGWRTNQGLKHQGPITQVRTGFQMAFGTNVPPELAKELPEPPMKSGAVLRAIYEVTLRFDDEIAANEEVRNTTAKVHAIMTVWPYWREHVQSSIVKMGFEAFPLPFLLLPQAVQMASLWTPPAPNQTQEAHGEKSEPAAKE